MNESPEYIAAADPMEDLRRVESGFGRFKIQAPMRSGPVVVLRVRAKDAQQVAPAEEEDVVQALSPSAADPALGDGVRPRRADGSHHHREFFGPEDLIEWAGELRVSIPEQDALLREPSRDTCPTERDRNRSRLAEVTWYSRENAAERAGVEPSYLARLVDLGILAPGGQDRFSAGDVRRVLMAKSLEDAGIPLDGVTAAIQRGALSLDFLDATSYERFVAFAAETFRQVSDRTGIPLELLMVIREAIGMAQPSPDDRLREDEMAIVPFLELQLSEGFQPAAIERLLRVQGDSTRRIAEQEAAWWNSEVIEPAMAAGNGPEEIANADLADRAAPLSEQALLAMYHAQQARAWTANLVEGFEGLMAKAGIRSRLERLPAICFLDIARYTWLTQERGDDAAADLAATVARLVRHSSVQHGGKPIKWLGDGVMIYFDDPGRGVRAALEMVDRLAAARLPPAHVGLHAGPVLFQEGDYFGQTVNLSARIADYARPGEVLVSEAVADASQAKGITFGDIGPVELKGVSGSVRLLRAHLG